MRRVAITFRELLERILPLDRLSPGELARIKDALARDDARELERLAYQQMLRLVDLGLARPLPERVESGERAVRFQLTQTLESVSFRYPQPVLPRGLTSFSRSLVTSGARPAAHRLESLLGLDQALIREDTRMPSGKADLVAALLRSARELLECDAAAFFPLRPPAEVPGEFVPPPNEVPLLGRWFAESVTEKNQILVCADATHAPEVAEIAAARGFASAAAVRIRGEAAGVTGVLEVRAAEPAFFDANRLSLLSLLAESFDTLLVQAARLQHLVYVDPLTGAFNRSFFQREIAGEVARARREAKSVALCIVDVDDFKRFNSDYGYEAGNQVLVEMARLLKGGLRPFDSVARWGGEEFAILLAAPVGRDDAETVAQRLRLAIEEARFTITGLDRQDHSVGVTISLGIALFPSDADSAEDLWRHANKALLVAKRPPKNQIVFYSELPAKGS